MTLADRIYTYSHAVPGMQAESAEKVAALIEAAG